MVPKICVILELHKEAQRKEHKMSKAHTILVSDLVDLHNSGTDCPVSGDEMTIALAGMDKRIIKHTRLECDRTYRNYERMGANLSDIAHHEDLDLYTFTILN